MKQKKNICKYSKVNTEIEKNLKSMIKYIIRETITKIYSEKIIISEDLDLDTLSRFVIVKK